MAGSTAKVSDKILAEARDYGQHLAEMLAASHFSKADQEAWAFLIPQMTLEQLKKLENVLLADLANQAKPELEDLIVSMKAAEHQHALSVAAIDETAAQAMDNLERDLSSAG